MSSDGDHHVLIVEDDLDASANIADILELDGYTCEAATTISESLQRLRGAKYSAIVLDRKLPDGQAIDFLPEIRHLAPTTAVVVVTGFADLDGAVQALRFGASDYILKPINADALLATLQRIHTSRASEAEISRLNRDLGRRQTELDTVLDVFPSDFAVAIAEDADCRFIHVNDSFARILGIPREMNASLSVDVPDRPPIVCMEGGRVLAADEMPIQQSALYEKTVRGIEIDIRRADGATTTVLCYSTPLYDEAGKSRGAIGAFLDITQRKKAARALEQSEKRFHAIFENSLDGLIVLDDLGRIVDANPAACDKLGRADDGLNGRRLDEMLRCQDPQGSHVDWQSLIKTGHATGECQAVHSDGNTLDIEYRAAANFVPGLHIISIHDITERKRSEQRALQSERLAAIGETMAALVHESRNALQRSRACLEMLSMEVEEQPEATDLVQRALKAQDRLQQLYEEVRQYAAPIKLDIESLDLSRTWRTAWSNVMAANPERQLQLKESIEADDVRCNVDRSRLEQVFVNIFENAQQVSPSNGDIYVRCTSLIDKEQPAVQISIRDQGPGMSREQRGRIFEAFFTTKSKGTGLGMSIVQRIVNAHGGHIAVVDQDGPGAEIVLTIPRTKP